MSEIQLDLVEAPTELAAHLQGWDKAPLREFGRIAARELRD
jgi:hypothetical protein